MAPTPPAESACTDTGPRHHPAGAAGVGTAWGSGSERPAIQDRGRPPRPTRAGGPYLPAFPPSLNYPPSLRPLRQVPPDLRPLLRRHVRRRLREHAVERLDLLGSVRVADIAATGQAVGIAEFLPGLVEHEVERDPARAAHGFEQLGAAGILPRFLVGGAPLHRELLPLATGR